MTPSSRRLVVRYALRRLSQRDTLLELHQGLASVLNSTARALGVQHRVSVERVAPEPPKAPPPERRLQSALRYMTHEDIEAYVDRLVAAGRLGDLEGLALQRGAERFIYSHCVKILLCVMHEALDHLTGTIFGVRVGLCDQTPRAKLDLLGALQRRLDDDGACAVRVDVRSVSAFVDGVVQVEREAGRAILGGSQALERVLHHNVAVLVLNLWADACSTYRVDFFGHSLRLAVEPNDTLRDVSLDALRRHRDKKHAVFDQRLVDALTEEIISDKDINMWLVPDAVERNFYRQFFAFYGVLLDYALCEMRLSLLDVDARVVFDPLAAGEKSSSTPPESRRHDDSSN